MEEYRYELLRELSDELGLEFETQDWGIINADTSRLQEFIDFYENRELKRPEAYQVFELVLASMNKALGDGVDVRKLIHGFVDVHGHDFPDQVEYWSCLPSNDEFPIGSALRAILREY